MAKMATPKPNAPTIHQQQLIDSPRETAPTGCTGGSQYQAGDIDRRRHLGEDAMPTIIGHHNITKDSKHWLNSPKRKELFGSLGITNIRTFVDPQNPKRVAVMMDVPDMDALAAMMQSQKAADAMAFDGVVPESLVILVEAKG
jgi:hypothetical protein